MTSLFLFSTKRIASTSDKFPSHRAIDTASKFSCRHWIVAQVGSGSFWPNRAILPNKLSRTMTQTSYLLPAWFDSQKSTGSWIRCCSWIDNSTQLRARNAYHRCFAFVLLYEHDPSVDISLRQSLTSHIGPFRNDVRDMLVPEQFHDLLISEAKSKYSAANLNFAKFLRIVRFY